METALTDVEKEQIRAQIIQQLAKVDEALAHLQKKQLSAALATGRTKKKDSASLCIDAPDDATVAMGLALDALSRGAVVESEVFSSLRRHTIGFDASAVYGVLRAMGVVQNARSCREPRPVAASTAEDAESKSFAARIVARARHLQPKLFTRIDVVERSQEPTASGGGGAAPLEIHQRLLGRSWRLYAAHPGFQSSYLTSHNFLA